MDNSGLSPLGALARGLAAGLVGNAAMDLTQMAVYRLHGEETGKLAELGGRSNARRDRPTRVRGRLQATGAASPATIGCFQRAVLWSYGPAWAGLYGLAEASVAHRRPFLHGTIFGLFMWGLGSGVMGPATGLAKTPWEYSLTTNVLDVGYHLAYGLGTAGPYRGLTRRELGDG
jgi:hypothetical protein